MSQNRFEMKYSIEDVIKDFLKVPNLVIFACKNNKVEALKYLLNTDGEDLQNDKRTLKLSTDVDDCQHNAFYYALLSGNTELLETLVTKWLDLPKNVEELDDVLSKTYEEFKLKNIPLSYDTTVYVETQLINLRLFSNNTELPNNTQLSLTNIKERIRFLVENIALLSAEYSNEQKIDDRFLFLAKFIAQNIHVLKQQLKSTYKVLPWEEIEFSLVSFISLHVEKDKIFDLYCQFTLNKKKVLKYLDIFSEKLQEEAKKLEDTEIKKINELPMISRELAVEYIVRLCSEFEELYNDHQQIRDIHSLSKMKQYIELSLAIDDPKEKESQLVITRALTVIGAHIRNSLESPKLSKDITDFLLFPLSNNTKKIVIGLRDSLTHATALFQRTKYIDLNNDDTFFAAIQDDFKKLGSSIADILHRSRIDIMRLLLRKIMDSDNLDEIRDISETLIFHEVPFDDCNGGFLYDKTRYLLSNLRNIIATPSPYEVLILERIDSAIRLERKSDVINRINYDSAREAFVLFNAVEDQVEIDRFNLTTEVINWAKQLLNAITPEEENLNNYYKMFSKLSFEIFDCVKPRTQNDKIKMKELNETVCGINFIAYFATSDVIFKKQLYQKMNARFSEIEKDELKNNLHSTSENYFELLNLKFDELRHVLENTTSKNKKPNVEVLLLDILTILDVSKIRLLENNILSDNANAPLPIGKNLRNHLAHGDALVDLLLPDTSTSIYAIAKKLVEEKENIIAGNKIIGEGVQEDLTKIKENYEWRLMIVTIQQNMFTALQNGNFSQFQCCLEKGADIHAKCCRMRTALHYASIGGNMEIVKELFDKNVSAEAKDVHGKTALHVAAEYGRADIVEYLLEKHNVFVDATTDLDETPLSLAVAKGHKETVEILLKYNAEKYTRNPPITYIKSPLQKSVLNNHRDILEDLFKKEDPLSTLDAIKQFKLLQLATRSGNQDMMKFLLEKGADVNGMDFDSEEPPLHFAAQQGNLAVVNILIEHEADVNLKDKKGFVALHFAAVNGHEKVVEILLKRGADIDYLDNVKNTPLHYAIENNHEKVIEILLENGAKPDLRNLEGQTALHYATKLVNLTVIQSLLKLGVEINSKDQSNCTPLHCLASYGGDVKIAKLLFKNGADINAENSSSLTPLHLAAEAGFAEFVAFLLEHGAEINARDKEHNTPLHKAARAGKLGAVKILVANKALINVENRVGCTPLFYAASCGFSEITEHLLENGAKEDRYKKLDYSAMNSAITLGHADVLKVLLKYRSKINDNNMKDGTAVYAAVDASHKDILEILIANGANINLLDAENETLLCAIKRNRKEIIELLLSYTAKVEGELRFLAVENGWNDAFGYLLEKSARFKQKIKDCGYHILESAISVGNTELVNTLTRNGAYVNDYINYVGNKTSILHVALINKQNEIVKVLVDNGANVNIETFHLGPPLRYAVAENNFECVKILVNSGKVKMNMKDALRYTSLHVATANGNLEMTKYLVDNGSDINATRLGLKAIHFAAMNGFTKIVEYFINKGQSVDELNSIKQTPLHLASLNNQMEVAKYLILQKADVNYQDKYGTTSLQNALLYHFTDIANLLLDNGAYSSEKSSKHNADTADQSKQESTSVKKKNRKKGNSKQSKVCFCDTNFKLKEYDEQQKLIPVVGKGDKALEECIALSAKVDETGQEGMITAACNRDKDAVKASKAMGESVNEIGSDGRSPLHYAVHDGRTNDVRILLANGANVAQVTSKGNTPLHTAVSRNNKEIVDMLLQHPSCQLNEFIDAKTTQSGSTALHVAAKNNALGIIKSLLKNGAAYDALNQKGEIPCSLSSDQHVNSFLKLVENLFTYVKCGNAEAIKILKTLNTDEFLAATNARNNQGATLLQVANANKKKNITNQLIHIIRSRNQKSRKGIGK